MVQQTLQKPVAPNANSSHKRDCRILLSFPPDPLQLKRAIQNVVQKNDVLPHESTRCNYVRQRETTKLANISVVRRQTRILDAQIAVVSQKKTYNAGVRNKSSILKYADSLQPLPTCRGMQTFYWCMKSAGLVQEFRLTVSNTSRRSFIYRLETIGIAPEAESQTISKKLIQKPTTHTKTCPAPQTAVKLFNRYRSHAHKPLTDAAVKINPCGSVRVNGISFRERL